MFDTINKLNVRINKNIFAEDLIQNKDTLVILNNSKHCNNHKEKEFREKILSSSIKKNDINQLPDTLFEGGIAKILKSLRIH